MNQYLDLPLLIGGPSVVDATATVDAVLQGALEATATVDAVLLGNLTVEAEVDARLVRLHAEPMATVDAILITGAPRYIFGDMILRDVAWTAAEFAAWATDKRPVGYDPRKIFLPADYQFEDAVVQLNVVAPSESTDQVAILSGKITVDVPDIVDRGNEAVPDTGATVAFTRTFVNAASIEVTAVWTGGTTPAFVKVENITLSGFDVALYDVANPSTLVDGTISWTAQGY